MADYLVKTVGNKKWLWFKNTNNYLQIDEDVFNVFEQLQKQNSKEDVVRWCIQHYNLPENEAQKTVNKIDALFSEQLKEKAFFDKEEIKVKSPSSFFSSKKYYFNAAVFHLFYSDANLETMFHPLFAHLETNKNDSASQNLNLFIYDEKYILNVDGNQLGSWVKNEEHVFKGQVFMALLNKAYSKTEEDWLGVLHASAVGNDRNSVLFLGDSGNGKSTASAIALASGLSLIADDFVPIDTSGQVLAFPAAISVKKQALEFLSTRFPELLKAKEYELKAMNKTVRYLAPKIIQHNPSRNIKALVFIQYTTDVDFELKPLDIHLAFKYLVSDSWLSPKEENARFFMDWIADLPAYHLRYSNNEKMLSAVQKLLIDD
ncbi:MAG: hypothetical protein PF484_06655 [Bacteroidales bacterium]|jgi:hypothetical protein|nr:hypothetical protein [Bacteroidales bacterium]